MDGECGFGTFSNPIVIAAQLLPVHTEYLASHMECIYHVNRCLKRTVFFIFIIYFRVVVTDSSVIQCLVYSLNFIIYIRVVVKDGSVIQ